LVKFGNLGILFLALMETLLVPYTVFYVALSLLGFEQPAYLYVNGFEDFPSAVLVSLLGGAGLMIYGAYRSWQELMKEEQK
jgi:hypothetical protein